MFREKCGWRAVMLGVFAFSLCGYVRAQDPDSGTSGAALAVQPPAGLVITRATTTGEVRDGLAKLRMRLEARCHLSGRQSQRLFGADVAITGWSVRSGWLGPNAHLRRSADGLELVVKGSGRIKASIEFAARVSRHGSSQSVALPIVPALATITSLTVPGADVEFSTSAPVGLETHVRGGATTVTIYGGEGTVNLTWAPRVPEKVLKPVVFANQATDVHVAQGVMRVNSRIEFQIVQGSVGRFDVRLPADCSLLNIEGADIRNWDVIGQETEGPRTLQVTLMDSVKESYRLALRLEKVLPEARAEIDLPAVVPLNVVREKGDVAVLAARGISVEPVELDNISHMDVQEMMALRTDLPGADRADELRLAFRYLKRPFTLKLRIGEVVAKTSVEVLTLVRAGLDSMRLTTSLHYTIRDAGVFRFRVRLEGGQKLIDINGPNINNWQLDDAGGVLSVALRSKAEGTYQLQIETELDNPAPEKALVPAVHALDVDRETGYVGVLPAPGVKTETAALAGISQIDVKELPQELLRHSPALAYRYIRPGYRLEINISEIEPEVSAEVHTIAVLDEHELSLETQIHYTIRRAGIFQLHVAIPKELRRTNVEGQDIDDTSWDEEKGVLIVNLRSKVIGSYVLKIATVKTLEGKLEDGVELPVIRTIGVRKERGFLALTTTASVRVKPAEGQISGLDDVGVSDLPPQMLRQAGEVALAFKYFSQPWSLTLVVERIEPRVTAEVFNLLSVGEKLMTVSATVSYNIAHAGVDTFRIKLPPDAGAVDIDGEAIKHREEDEATGTWTVTLQSTRTGSYALYVSFEHKLSSDQTVIPYAGAEAVGVQRETGYLAVTSRPDVELIVAEEDIENLTPIDSREIPQGYMQGLALPVLLAYRYVSHPYMIRIGASPHGAADVTVAVVESARLSTTITEEGNMITDVVCILRNSRQQYLNLKLPERIWHLFVAGQAVTPLLDGEITKIPVARVAGTSAPFEIRLRYSEERADLGRTGLIRLESPFQDIDVMRLGWTLSLPEGYDIVRDTGDIRRLDGFHRMEQGLQRLQPDLEVSGSVRRSPALAQQAGPQFMRNEAVQQRILAGAKGEGRYNVSIYTGSKPAQAAAFAFQSLILSAEEPAWIEAHYVKQSLGIPLQGVLVLLVVLGCAAIWRIRLWPRLGRVFIILGAALAVLAVRTLSEGAYRTYLTTALITLLVVAAGLLLYTVATWVRQGWTRWHARKRALRA